MKIRSPVCVTWGLTSRNSPADRGQDQQGQLDRNAQLDPHQELEHPVGPAKLQDRQDPKKTAQKEHPHQDKDQPMVLGEGQRRTQQHHTKSQPEDRVEPELVVHIHALKTKGEPLPATNAIMNATKESRRRCRTNQNDTGPDPQNHQPEDE